MGSIRRRPSRDRGAPHACALSRGLVLLAMEYKFAAESAFARRVLIEISTMAGDAMCADPRRPAVSMGAGLESVK